jgi:hypothetical protein
VDQRGLPAQETVGEGREGQAVDAATEGDRDRATVLQDSFEPRGRLGEIRRFARRT